MCKQELPFEAFNKKSDRKDGLQGQCRECWKVYYKEHYYQQGKEKDRLARKRDTERAAIREHLVAAKSVPCADCGVQYPSYVMDFDHLGNKSFTIGGSAPHQSLAKIKAEIAKCEVVCSNCHRQRTWQRQQTPVV